MKKRKLIITGMLILLVYWIYSINDSAGMSGAKVSWVNDINQLEETLTKESPGAFRNVSKKEFHKKLQELIKETSKMSDGDISIKLKEIVKSLKDENTDIILKDSAFKKVFPVITFENANKYEVISIDNEHSQVLGGEIVKINDKSVKEIEDICKKLVYNTYKNNENLSVYLNDLEMLQFLKVVQGEEAKFTFKDVNGDIRSFDLTARASSTGYNMVSSPPKYESIKSTEPAFENNEQQIWYKCIEQDRTLYCKYSIISTVVYRVLQNVPDAKTMEVYKKMDEDVYNNVENTLDDFVKEANNNNYEKLVIDMRFSFLLNPNVMKGFIEKIEKIQPLNKKSKIYIITPSSSATTIIPELQKLKATGKYIFYGEKNLSYQDFNNETIMNLKNSKIGVIYSKENDLKKLNSQFKPDFLIKMNTDDYYNGHDLIYDAIQGRK